MEILIILAFISKIVYKFVPVKVAIFYNFSTIIFIFIYGLIVYSTSSNQMSIMDVELNIGGFMAVVMLYTLIQIFLALIYFYPPSDKYN